MDYYYCTKKPFSKRLIGSSNFGWAFLLVVDWVPDLIAWKEKFNEPGSYIKNEEGISISIEDMVMFITFREGVDADVTNRALQHFRGRVFVGTHNLVHIIAGETTFGYSGIANEDCWDLCRYK